MSTTIIFGPPGTGKTTKLLNMMEREIYAGTDPSRIAFVSFTKAAVNEATTRASDKFNIAKKDLRWFRTLHSLAFYALGLSRELVMSDYRDFAKSNGFSISKKKEGADVVFSDRNSDELIVYLRSLVEATGMSPADVARHWKLGNISLRRYDQFCKSISEWKKEKKLVEYSDMLSMFISERQSIDVDVAFIDEAQDLTPVQWKMVGLAFKDAKKIVIAGDDDQAIYRWAGADVERMLKIDGTQIILNKSYRVPESIHKFARGITSNIKVRKDKDWSSSGSEGSLLRETLLHRIDMTKGSWMLLGRTAMTLPTYKDELEKRGINYRINGEQVVSKEEISAYKTLQALRDGDSVSSVDARILMKLSNIKTIKFKSANVCNKDIGDVLTKDNVMLCMIKPSKLRFINRIKNLDDVRVDVSTIHGVKGSEADNVILSPTMSRATAQALRAEAYSDSEHRVWYVGATRAKEKLFILREDGENNYIFGRNS
ncbi:AAA domain containing protein [uncultured Caudovirales phage]|uniref:DNA 3'-5' helicase n=1 Tax=uncultured Caudovirales phage TaxID=2100421 RepID=A0A6J5QNW8_9CAUD|nr:AAA domain containing protein [uncultured Caudovirales phage]CAB4176380.1 AAA domain containing protein [uncultured Caudovirales phage]CAB4183181.1 AAA domain containing protein [uncultured Caudovirales phage]CAB4197217.1 AAA domain containing protein [uncultured Caudovirales phage]CAB4212566.1 AAA domain containing protein [uncultured Caudovirales phage]